jgi:hypothetical protein
MIKNCPLDLDKVFPQNDVQMEINNNLNFLIKNSIIMTTT